MLQARLTTSQLAERAQIPVGSIGFYIASGLLEPTIQGAGGKGHPRVFAFKDLVVAMAVSKMRLPNISVEGMQEVAKFWRGLKEPDLRTTALAYVGAEKAKVSEEKVLVLLENGSLVVEDNLPILELTRKYGSSVVHIVDAGQLANQALVNLTEDHIEGKFPQPGPSGRLPRGPRRKGPAPRREGPEPSQAVAKRATVQLKRGADKPSSNKTRRRGR